jgi:senataxin
VQPGQAPRRLPPAKKLLVCAPSNAAIDEVAKRIKEGVRDSTGRVVFPKVVRIGPTDSVSAAVRDISLDDLVAAKLSIDPKESTDVSGEIASIRGELEVVKRQREAKQAELRSLQDNTSRYVILEKEVTELNRKRMQLTSRLDKIKDKQQSSNRTLDANRRRFRLEVLQEADVICSTLSASGHELLDSFEFETVVIDEAAQSIELSSLIPLKYRCRRCVLVGGMVVIIFHHVM